MNVETLFKMAGADAKGQYTSPTAGSSEWYQWLSWSNEELQTYGEVHDWPELKTNLPISTSGTSGALPINFKKISGYLNVNGALNKEVDSDQFDLFDSSTNVFRSGYNNGWFVEWKKSGTSIVLPIQSYPTSLLTVTDQINIRNPIYLVKRLKVRIFKYRQDPVFTEIETEANLMLSQMIENEFYKHSQYRGGALSREEESGFTLGVD